MNSLCLAYLVLVTNKAGVGQGFYWTHLCLEYFERFADPTSVLCEEVCTLGAHREAGNGNSAEPEQGEFSSCISNPVPHGRVGWLNRKSLSDFEMCVYIVGETVFCLNTICLFLFCPSPLLGTLTAQKSFQGSSVLTRGRHRWPLWKPLSSVFALGHSDCISYLWRDESHIDL